MWWLATSLGFSVRIENWRKAGLGRGAENVAYSHTCPPRCACTISAALRMPTHLAPAPRARASRRRPRLRHAHAHMPRALRKLAQRRSVGVDPHWLQPPRGRGPELSWKFPHRFEGGCAPIGDLDQPPHLARRRRHRPTEVRAAGVCGVRGWERHGAVGWGRGVCEGVDGW
jgi:hypothetical protein